MNKGKVVLIVVAILVCVTIGFVAGQVVQAMTTLPGTTDDPVATESYVETTIGERLATLSTKVEELESEVAALKGGVPTTGTTGAAAATGSTGTTAGSTTSNVSGSTLTITGNGVNLRSAASRNGEIITTLSRDTKVNRLGQDGDWYKVETSDGQVGYVSSSYAE